MARGEVLELFEIVLRAKSVEVKDVYKDTHYDVNAFGGYLPIRIYDTFTDPYWVNINKINTSNWFYWDDWNGRFNFGDSRAWYQEESSGDIVCILQPPSGGNKSTRCGLSLNRLIKVETGQPKTIKFDVSPEISKSWAVFSISPEIISDDVDGDERKSNDDVSYWLKIKRNSQQYLHYEIWYKASGVAGIGSKIAYGDRSTNNQEFVNIKIITGENLYQVFVNGISVYNGLNSTGISNTLSCRISSRYLDDSNRGYVKFDNFSVE